MKIGKYEINFLNTSFHSLFSDSWSMSKSYKILYKSIDIMVIFVINGKLKSIKHFTIPYFAIYNKNWKEDKKICEKSLALIKEKNEK